MRLGVLIILAILPVILICKYVYKKDREKEPAILLLKLFFLGIISCFLVLIVSNIISYIFPFMNKDTTNMTFLEVFLYSFVCVGLVEECCKWFMVYNVGYHNKEFDEPYDIIVYSIFVALGFAAFENFLYVLPNDSITIGVTRGLLAVPGHACDAIFMGYYLSIAKLKAKGNNEAIERKNIYKSILIPTLLHGIYDFCLLSGEPFLLGTFLVFIIGLYKISLKRLKEVASTVKKLEYKNKYCPYCGALVDGNYCSICGSKQE